MSTILSITDWTPRRQCFRPDLGQSRVSSSERFVSSEVSLLLMMILTGFLEQSDTESPIWGFLVHLDSSDSADTCEWMCSYVSELQQLINTRQSWAFRRRSRDFSLIFLCPCTVGFLFPWQFRLCRHICERSELQSDSTNLSLCESRRLRRVEDLFLWRWRFSKACRGRSCEGSTSGSKGTSL